MAAKEIAVKKYIVKLSAEERDWLNTLIQSDQHAARKLTRARILLKADAGDAGEAWSDSQIAAAPDTGLVTVAEFGANWSKKGSIPCRREALTSLGQTADLRWRG